MAPPKILVIPGSLRAQSYNIRLAALATKELTLAGKRREASGVKGIGSEE